jgi:hypothetical protein
MMGDSKRRLAHLYYKFNAQNEIPARGSMAYDIACFIRTPACRRMK